MKFLKFLPNLFTLLNLFCGCLAILLMFVGDIFVESSFDTIIYLFSASLLFDFFDGLVARWLNVQSEIGKQLDSLSDLVTFGVLPGFALINVISKYSVKDSINVPLVGDFIPKIVILSPLLIILFSAYRLAKFNIDTEQSYYFKGLNTPTNAILIISLFYIQKNQGVLISEKLDIYFLFFVLIFSCLLLVSNLPLFSLKFKDYSWQNNHFKYVFLGICVVALIIYQFYAIPFLILLYILTSIIFRKKIIQ